ncbi:MAG: hypothetical protein M3R11_00425 [Acidobacteriota bacterium]|jgi:hypothetical protein|nr:hypothetical protein [Acidobacteriota bacterium]
MREKFYMNWLRNITAACLAMVIFTTSSMIALAGTETKSLMGEITVSGQNTNGNVPSVLLNGENAFTGRTFFSNGTITTSEAVTSTVKLGKLGYVTMSPNTTLTLSFDEKTISGTLSAGNAQVFNAEGVDVNIQNLGNATTSVAPMNKAQDDDDDDGAFSNSAVGPIIVFAGIVAAAVILVVVNDDDDEDLVVSRVR